VISLGQYIGLGVVLAGLTANLMRGSEKKGPPAAETDEEAAIEKQGLLDQSESETDEASDEDDLDSLESGDSDKGADMPVDKTANAEGTKKGRSRRNSTKHKLRQLKHLHVSAMHEVSADKLMGPHGSIANERKPAHFNLNKDAVFRMTTAD